MVQVAHCRRAKAPLFGGNQLLVLPDCRPTLGLISSISLQVPPETVLQLDGPDSAGVLRAQIVFRPLRSRRRLARTELQLRLDFGPIKAPSHLLILMPRLRSKCITHFRRGPILKSSIR